MKTVTYHCDRCNKEVKDVEAMSFRYRRVDLCWICMNALIVWTRGESND